MSARILDGSALAAEVRAEVARNVAAHRAAHGPIRLCAILAGSDQAGQLYARSQRKQCENVGIAYELIELPHDISEARLRDEIDRLNAAPDVTGIMLHLPLPPGIEPAAAQYRIDPYKDVEGVNPANIGLLFYGQPIIAPCTALAVNELLLRSGAALTGAHAVVVGQGRIVGKPITMFLLENQATVTACHAATRDLCSHTREADILVVAVGRPRTITARHVKAGAVVVDVGINSVVERDAGGSDVRRTVGDVDFTEVAPLASAITPVPGGVGPMTVAMLLRNTVEAARKQLHRRL
ncbi:MAG: Bifunctional protein FolD protein [Phycisphaerae bacterium]|nr:Bifunctional protein FolD protein [Phycisphaerae bacterium]